MLSLAPFPLLHLPVFSSRSFSRCMLPIANSQHARQFWKSILVKTDQYYVCHGDRYIWRRGSVKNTCGEKHHGKKHTFPSHVTSTVKHSSPVKRGNTSLEIHAKCLQVYFCEIFEYYLCVIILSKLIFKKMTIMWTELFHLLDMIWFWYKTHWPCRKS